MNNPENIPENITDQTLKTNLKPNEEIFEFDIIGMDCTSCAGNIKKHLERLDGISNVEINYATESGEVIYDPEKIIRNKIKEEVKNTGYDLISEDDEYEAEQLKKQSIKKQKDKIYTAISLSVITMTLSMKDHIPVINMIHLPFKLILVVLFLLTTVIIFWCGDRFIKGAFTALRNKTSDMNTLITIGSLSSYFYSIYISANILFNLKIEALADTTEVYYETAAMIITFIMIGNYLESVMKSKTQNSIRRLKELQTKVVNVMRDGVEIFIPFRKVKVDDTVLIKTGDRIPVDGILTTGFCVVDESAMTGESLPVEKKTGDSLMSGTMLRNGFAEMKAVRVGNDTMLSKIITLVKDASDNKPKIQKLADKISSVFVPVVILISVATFLIWYLALNERFDNSLLYAVSVLIIACPCALGLASPIAIIIGVGRAAENGILFNNVDAIEQLKNINTVCFDKTGTLTTGEMKVKNIYLINDYSKDELMTYAVTIEKLSSHPVAKSIVNYGKDNNIKIFKDIKDFKTENGLGISALVNGKSVLIGNENFMKNNNIKFSNILIQAGRNNLFISISNEIEGVIELEDSIKEEAKNALSNLRSLGLSIFMISGDNENAAKKTANELNIKNYSYKTLPDEKEKIISKFQRENKNVAMVGDGINDAPSLAKANVGIAVGTGQDIAIDSADVILVKGDLNNITKAITISKMTVKIIKQNFFWAFFYNAVTIPIAAGLFASYGLIISPVMAAMIMAFSDVVTVIGNSMRLKYMKL